MPKLWDTYAPAKRDKTIYVFTAIGLAPVIAAELLVSHYGRPFARLAFALTLLGLLLIIVGPIVKWRRWSRDPGFQEFLKSKKESIRKNFPA